jgi:chemotaxis protein MotB
MNPTTVDAGDEGHIPGLPRRKPGRLGWLFFTFLFVLFALFVSATGAFVFMRYLPERDKAQANAKALADETALRNDLERQLKQARTGLHSTRAERDQLDVERARALQEKETAIRELERVKGELSASLEGEMSSGDVGIERRGRELVVDVADQVLFEVGDAEVSERGKELLKRVALALAKRTDHVVQVRGHTDSAAITSPETRERFPTNWELSTARATHVVRFLQDFGHISGQRLMAAGFAQYRPISSNTSEVGRRKNRRIEIVLISETPATDSR